MPFIHRRRSLGWDARKRQGWWLESTWPLLCFYHPWHFVEQHENIPQRQHLAVIATFSIRARSSSLYTYSLNSSFGSRDTFICIKKCMTSSSWVPPPCLQAVFAKQWYRIVAFQHRRWMALPLPWASWSFFFMVNKLCRQFLMAIVFNRCFFQKVVIRFHAGESAKKKEDSSSLIQ